MRIGIILALISAFGYGLSISFARIASSQGISGADLTLFRALLLLAVSVPFVIHTTPRIKKEDLPLIFFMGLISGLVGLCYFTAVKFIPVATATMIFYTFPLFILILSPLIEKTALSRKLIFLTLLAFSGIYLIIGAKFNLLDWRGIAASLGASLTATAQFFLAKRITPKFSAMHLVFLVHCIILPFIIGVILLTEGFKPLTQIQTAWLPISVVAMSYISGFLCQMQASKSIPPALLGLLFTFEPVIAVIGAYFILGESVTFIQIFGIALVIIALVEASRNALKA